MKTVGMQPISTNNWGSPPTLTAKNFEILNCDTISFAGMTLKDFCKRLFGIRIPGWAKPSKSNPPQRHRGHRRKPRVDRGSAKCGATAGASGPTAASAERSALTRMRVMPKSWGVRGKLFPALLNFSKFAEFSAHRKYFRPSRNLAAGQYVGLGNDKFEVLSVAYGEDHSVGFDSHELCRLEICHQHHLLSDKVFW